MKLLTLYGRRDGGLEWRLNKYRDGSGSDTTVIPCQSIEEAREVARRGFLDLWTDARRVTEKSLHLARECGVQVPPEIIEQFRAGREEYARKQVAQLEQRLEAARAELQAALA